MSTITVKLSEENLKAIGATAGDAEEKLAAFIKAKSKSEADVKVSIDDAREFRADIGEIKDRLKAVETREVKAVVSAEDHKAILDAASASAKDVAAKEVSSAIAKVGVNSVAAGNPGDENPGTPPKAGATLSNEDMKATDAETIWKTNASIRDEFMVKEAFLAFHRANIEGRVH